MKRFKSLLFSIVALAILCIAIWSVVYPKVADTKIILVYAHKTPDKYYGWFIDSGGSLYKYDFSNSDEDIPLQVIIDSDQSPMFLGPFIPHSVCKDGDKLIQSDSIKTIPDEKGEIKTLTYFSGDDSVVVYVNGNTNGSEEATRIVKWFNALSMLAGQ